MTYNKLLVVDDDEIDVEAIRRCIRHTQAPYTVVHARDGQEALEMLSEKADFEPPSVVLLDLNMPRMDGFEFLEAIQQDEHLCKNRVFVFSTSSDSRDIERAYVSGAVGYVIKSNNLRQLKDFLAMIEMYEATVELP